MLNPSRYCRSFLTFVLVALTNTVHAQISPGDLSKAHESLEGISHCTSCHALGSAVAGDKCLACHTELAARMSRGRGFHRNLMGQPCVVCHKEHFGRDFSVIQWGKGTFDHGSTGLVLLGKHLTLQCRKCHTHGLIRANDILEGRTVSADRTYLGLSPDCNACHKDPHQGALGETCTRCHSNVAWKPAPGFSHQKTRYPLTGKHTEVRCALCHSRPEGAVHKVVYAGLPFNDCITCHVDPHRARFTQGCASCHGTGGWRSDARGFEHGSTRFPLRGAHANVRCEQCHGDPRGGKGPPAAKHIRIVRFEKCSDCHRDPHAGQFASRPGRGACEGCHSEKNWKVRAIAGFDHSTTRFPLKGKHLSLECGKCHVTPAASTARGVRVDMVRFEHCTNCHSDAHAGQFTVRSDGGACESCHATTGFLPPLYPPTEHDRSRFPLRGAHAAVTCNACHTAGIVLGKQVRVFRREALPSCATCHADKHNGAFIRWMTDGCKSCHVTSAWNDVRFAHERTGFALIGKHGKVPCAGCHRARFAPLSSWRFAGTTKACSGCHTQTDQSFLEAGL